MGELTEAFRLRPGVCSAVRDERLLLADATSSAAVGRATPGRQQMLHLLAGPAVPAKALREVSGDADEFLAVLRSGGWLMVTVRHGERALYTIRPLRPLAPAPAGHGPIVLSRFTLLRGDGGDLVCESPLADAEIALHAPEVRAAVSGLVEPTEPDDTTMTRLCRDLTAAGLAVLADDTSESTEFRLCQWQPHELWFHMRSRIAGRGYFGDGYGRTSWAATRFPALPARHESFPGPAVELSRPDLTELRTADLPLTAAIEDRTSTRIHDDTRPLTVEQLGQLLFRTARVRSDYVAGGVEYLRCPYPAGGGAYELEVYPVVRRVTGLPEGIYHYDRHAHRLNQISGMSRGVRRMLATASRATFERAQPQVLLLITARFGRLMWTYEQMPYALILKHVGVLFQTLYLTATAMDIAACALGGGDSTTFAELTGIDPTDESCVGEFIVGSQPG